ncbi:MAG: guanylate kinase [Bacilli bacterium]|nr:guanylate kinase [Bacilli bacterium]
MHKGLLIILSGPSGVGKGTVRAKLMEDKSLNLFYSISMTTRPMRAGEQNGREYYFVTREEFEKQVAADNFIEHAEFVGNYYGTPKDKVEEALSEGKNVLLEIEINGAQKVLDKCPDALSIFLVPPSMEALEARIRGRCTESEECIRGRLEKARSELTRASLYKFTVLNDSVDHAAETIANIIKSQLPK